jgi:polysaccharide pyruvyl transferase WcaK-like protein
MNNDGLESTNLGNQIIFESILENIQSLFPGKELVRVSSHVPLEPKHRKLFNNAFLSFIGGTNLLTYRIIRFMGMPIRNSDLVWLFPGVKDLIIFGAGWGYGYGRSISLRTKIFYKKFLHPKFSHSLRDQYSADKLSEEVAIKTCNTCCPSTWSVNIEQTNRTKFSNKCLFTFTDYATNPSADEKLLGILFSYFDDLIFFPQGAEDEEYIQSLSLYKKNKEKVFILPHSYTEFKNYLSTNEITYIGTRLHGGIKCLQHNYESMIIAFDNRTMEIAKDTNLPICPQSDYTVLLDWLEGKKVFNKSVLLPQDTIAKWKNQFTGL